MKTMKENINILFGDNSERTAETVAFLRRNGCRVQCTEKNPVHIQHTAGQESFDAAVLFGDTQLLDDLRTSLKSCCEGISVIVCRPGRCDGPGLLRELRGLVCREVSMAELHSCITDILSGFCLTPKYSGYRYIRDAIKLAVTAQDVTLSISKTIYPEIAKLNGTTASAVEMGIRTALHRCIPKSDDEKKLAYFGSYALKRDWSPTNREFIYVIADKLSCEFRNRLR
ncbi:MAG: sporulation initiation factor Spo0A C-terminal domain-containing protein [Ruminococcus sp.]|nr:sporulation initiation factor Spo0A C-terminal domain-containing protein [Ruminococcus sp.]MBR1863619.1 sporulation initiation factor Spo0A C-terminal domain-containing protein [Ruminococcus sp.]